ncbi:hypothetical protein [Umezawaea sp. Da 62-37]|uniref:hypothetical protein n=1 Tax=Umezawaea sp. Da 62-37 TaxID=3075927 RepID=UPI0028F6EDB0|nr:hypothetical protein [Umezawaea sp. Da 62-37]WNV83106.1 hypothetical protein RM788_33625 [Umezawaea sp. Da 62-37]
MIAAFIEQRLAWTSDDPVDQVMPLVLQSMAESMYVIGAHRLLQRLDTLVIREWVGKNGEDALFVVMSRVDDRVRELTYQLEQVRTALRLTDEPGTGESDVT